MLAGAIWARDASNQGNRLAAMLLLCAAFWSLCDVLSNTANDATTALEFVRWSCLGSIMVGPLAFHMLLTLEPKLRRRYGRFLRLAYGTGAFFALLGVATPALWVGVIPTKWGWAGDIGIGVAIAWAIVIPLPLAALVEWYRLADRTQAMDTWMGIAVGIPALIATLTDFVLPFAGIASPRLGSASLVAWGGVALWKVYRFRDPILAPHLFAREILATLPDGVMLLRLDGTIRAGNERMGSLIGTTVHELMGRPVGELLLESTPSDARARGEREFRLVRQSGEPITVSVDEAGLYDEEGNPLGRVLVVRDLREVVSLRDRLITSGRLAAVGQLAAGIAHEINNPIAYVQSDLNLLEEHWSAAKAEFEKSAAGLAHAELLREGEEMISESIEGIARVASIVRDVSGFSSNAEAEWESAEVDKLLDAAVRVAQPQLRHHASIERDYAELPMLRCVAQELMQVFLNLLLNAAQSMEEEGVIRLATRQSGDRFLIEVSDDGAGMNPYTLAQIFTPFFTTKPVGVGTGLGLSISRQIVEKHAGTIEAESSPGHGTTFRISFPMGDDRAAGRDEGAPE
jgi:PAS domain S-box-containing protein